MEKRPKVVSKEESIAIAKFEFLRRDFKLNIDKDKRPNLLHVCRICVSRTSH